VKALYYIVENLTLAKPADLSAWKKSSETDRKFPNFEHSPFAMFVNSFEEFILSKKSEKLAYF